MLVCHMCVRCKLRVRISYTGKFKTPIFILYLYLYMHYWFVSIWIWLSVVSLPITTHELQMYMYANAELEDRPSMVLFSTSFNKMIVIQGTIHRRLKTNATTNNVISEYKSIPKTAMSCNLVRIAYRFWREHCLIICIMWLCVSS